MMGDKSYISRLFLEARFRDVVDAFETNRSLQKDPQLFPLYVGSLVLLGHLEKALILFKSQTLEASAQISCRFYLALGCIRNSRYREGREFLILNCRALSKRAPAMDVFFTYQGVAFYRFFCGRFSAAQRAADISYRAAVEAQFTLGEILSQDLLAHALVQVGQVRLGLRYFSEALKLAQKHKNGWMAPAIEIAMLKYRAQFGINVVETLEELQSALKKIETKDVYSRGELLLELVRQYLLRGQFTRAEETLNQAADVVYNNQNRRQMALMNMRMSYLLFLRAQYAQSLHLLRVSEQSIDPRIDLNLWTQINGFKLHLLKVLKKEQEFESVRKDLIQKTSLSQNQVHLRIFRRQHLGRILGKTKSEDLIGDLLDRAQQKDPSAPLAVLESGLYGLLHKCYDLPFGTSSLIFDLHPGTIVLLDQGNVTVKKKGVNSVLRKIILRLNQGPQTKENLVQHIWGYSYDPLRHDSLIYSAMNKVRKLLAPHESWLILTENGYHLQSHLKIIVKNNLEAKEVAHGRSKVLRDKVKLPAQWAKHVEDLNFRQIQILDYLKKEASLSVQELSEKLMISKPTSTRDLSKLYSLGMVKRVGRGRATRYFL